MVITLMKFTAADRAKRKLNYRLAGRGEWARCLRCRELVSVAEADADGGIVGVGLRCDPIGTGTSPKYTIREDHVCDSFGERGN